MGNYTEITPSQQYTVIATGNVALGQLGCILEESIDPVTGTFVALQFLEDTVFTTLTPESSIFIGTSGGSGDSVSSNTFPQGITVFGRWTGFTLASGSVIAYNG
jgi:hypothetical protein